MTKPSRYSNGLGPHSRIPQSSLPGDFHSRLIVNTAEGIVTSPLALPSVTFSRNSMMINISYSGCRFPPEIILQAI
jgi:hypothetical protein